MNIALHRTSVCTCLISVWQRQGGALWTCRHDVNSWRWPCLHDVLRREIEPPTQCYGSLTIYYHTPPDTSEVLVVIILRLLSHICINTSKEADRLKGMFHLLFLKKCSKTLNSWIDF